MTGRLTSTVLRDPLNDWTERGLAIPHEAIRGELIEMNKVLVAQPHRFSAAKDEWRVRLFFHWYNRYFFAFIHEHHHLEEQIFFPWMQTRVQLPAKMSADHKQLVDMLDQIKAFEEKVLQAQGEEARRQQVTELCQLVSTMSRHLNEHIAEEEQIVPPLLKANFSEEEEKETVQKILKEMGLEGNALGLPLVMHYLHLWAGPEYANHMIQTELPAPIRFLYLNVWKGKFERENRGALVAMLEENEPVHKSDCAIL